MQHRDALSKLSQVYDFDYEFVWYKTPRFMPSETSQERRIWAYKILYLDVLFPVSVKRVIYIDSDDVVRSDLNELMQLDMNGAPYGFTPFCEDRPDMEEYRFWNDGYWRDILNGQRYHISALFVLDFRDFWNKMVGVVLRRSYRDLFSDKQSLANLDQDLPNLMQSHGVQIYALPQEWLWCQTWCSGETMGKAKVIDLCNDPKYHVPKLRFAKENISEWVGIDAEIDGVLRGEKEL
jgi:UDP-glucose:glycoprotein glucosyltransferase